MKITNPITELFIVPLLRTSKLCIAFIRLGIVCIFHVVEESLAAIDSALQKLENELLNWQTTNNTPKRKNSTFIDKLFNKLAILKANFSLLLKLPLDLILGVALQIVPLANAALKIVSNLIFWILSWVSHATGYYDVEYHLESDRKNFTETTLVDIEEYIYNVFYDAAEIIQSIAMNITDAISEIVFSPVTALLYFSDYIANGSNRSAVPPVRKDNNMQDMPESFSDDKQKLALTKPFRDVHTDAHSGVYFAHNPDINLPPSKENADEDSSHTYKSDEKSSSTSYNKYEAF